MATLALAAVGAAIGSAAVTGTVLGLSGAAWGWLIGSTAGAYLFAPTYRTEGPRLSDMKVSGGGYGIGIPQVIGSTRVSGNMIWSSELIERVSTEEVGGKGGGGGGTQVTTYSYSVNCAVGVCEGPVECIRRIWCNGKLIYNAGAGTQRTVDAEVIALSGITIYLGTEEQNPDPVIQAARGAGNVPAHRGLAYVVFEGLQLAKFGNRTPKFDFEVGGLGIFLLGRDLMTERNSVSYDWQNWEYVWKAAGATCDESPLDIDCYFGDTESMYVFGNGVDEFVMLELERPLDKWRLWFSSDGVTWVVKSNWFTKNRLWFSPEYSQWFTKHAGRYYLIGAYPQNLGYNSGEIYSPRTDYSALDVMGYYPQTPLGWGRPTSLFYSTALGKWVGAINYQKYFSQSNYVGNLYIFTGTTLNNLTIVKTFVDGTKSYQITVHPVLREFAGKFWIQTENEALDRQIVWSSTDCVNWVEEFDIPRESNSYYRNSVLVAGPDRLLLWWSDRGVSAPDGTFKVKMFAMHTTDGISWSTPVLIRNLDWNQWWDLPTYTAGHFVLVATNKNPNPPEGEWNYNADVYYSKDGVIWNWRSQQPNTIYFDGIQNIIGSIGNTCGFKTVSLSEAITVFAKKVGLTDADIDVTEVRGIAVNGYIVSNQMTARAAIEPLLAAYSVDGFESDGKIRFVPRSSGTVGPAIPQEHLGATIKSETFEEPVRIRRLQELELPNEVVIRYADRALNYDVNQQYARRIAGATDGVLTIDVPLVLNADEAAQLASEILYRTWVQREEFTFSTTQRYLAYEPSDIVYVPFGNEYRQVRLTKKEEFNPLINWTAVSEDLSVYSRGDAGSDGGETTPVIAEKAETDLMVFETPVLRDQDDYLQFTVLAGGDTAESWPGGTLFLMSKNATPVQVNFGPLPSRAITGRLLSNLPAVSDPITASWDTVNSFSVEIPWGALESRTADEVLSGFNTCVVQRADGSVEVLGFQAATLNAPGTYTLSNLLRRIRQNSSFSGGSTGDKFALLTQGTTRLLPAQLSDLGLTFEFAGPQYGSEVSEAPTQTLTLTGMSKKPLSPISVTGSRDEEGTLEISWTRRTRIGGSWPTGENGPLGEASELYEIDILSASSPQTVLRTLSSSTPTVIYDIVDQVEDFGSPAPEAVDVVVYQISSFIGRGYPARASV
jgi:hypothetical protein